MTFFGMLILVFTSAWVFTSAIQGFGLDDTSTKSKSKKKPSKEEVERAKEVLERNKPSMILAKMIASEITATSISKNPFEFYSIDKSSIKTRFKVPSKGIDIEFSVWGRGIAGDVVKWVSFDRLNPSFDSDSFDYYKSVHTSDIDCYMQVNGKFMSFNKNEQKIIEDAIVGAWKHLREVHLNKKELERQVLACDLIAKRMGVALPPGADIPALPAPEPKITLDSLKSKSKMKSSRNKPTMLETMEVYNKSNDYNFYKEFYSEPSNIKLNGLIK